MNSAEWVLSLTLTVTLTLRKISRLVKLVEDASFTLFSLSFNESKVRFKGNIFNFNYMSSLGEFCNLSSVLSAYTKIH